MFLKALNISLLFSCCFAMLCAANERMFLMQDGSKLRGTLIVMDADIILLRQSDGEEKKLTRKQVAGISDLLQKPKEDQKIDEAIAGMESDGNNPFGTPQQTFEKWRQAAVDGNIDAMVACYSAPQQEKTKKRLKSLSRKKRKAMRKDTAFTKFVLAKPYFQGDRAALEVTWQKGLTTQIQVLHFANESGKWKIIE